MERERGHVCSACILAIPRVSPADPLAREALHRLREASNVSSLIVPFYFEEHGPLQPLIHQLKYGGATRMGEELGVHLGRLIQRLSPGKGEGVFVPVPLHRARRRERGYNQAECICRGAAEILGWQVRADILIRRRYTTTQTKLKLE